MRHGRDYALVVALPLCALPLSGAPGAGGVAAAAGTAASPPAPTFLHVVTPSGGDDLTPYLADAAGRRILLRGVAAVGMQDVAYPGADGGPALFPVDPSAYDGRCPAAQARIPSPRCARWRPTDPPTSSRPPRAAATT